MNGSSEPWFWLIAGPNGVGKTRYAKSSLQRLTGNLHFVNLDEIARGLSPFDPQAARVDAARVALDRAGRLIAARQTFAMETTLSGKTHVTKLIPQARENGLKIGLAYYAVPRVEICIERVARRVLEGGHDVPETDIRRRFVRSAEQFPSVARAADRWRVFDGTDWEVALIAAGTLGRTELQDGAALAKLPITLPDWTTPPATAPSPAGARRG